MGRLEIRVCGARNIGNTQRIGTPDPYVKVKVGERNSKDRITFKTRVVENNLNPIWNELFKFQVADYDKTQILFELWNDRALVDELMGSYPLSINGLTRGVVRDCWVLLQGTTVSSAELHLRVLAVDFGADPAPGEMVISSIEQDQLATPSHQVFRPNRKDSPNQTPYPQAPQGLPQQVTYGAQYQQQQQQFTGAMYNPNAPPPQPVSYGAPQQPMYQQLPPPAAYGAPLMQAAAYGAPPPPGMYGAPPPQPYYQPPPPAAEPMRPPNFQAMWPPQQNYGVPPQAPGLQMAYGVPPDM